MSSRTGKKAPSSKIRAMADGLNEARAMRVAEVMNDFHLIQRRMSHFQATPSPDEYHDEAFVILRQCQAEARAVLAAPFQAELLQAPRGPDEAEKRQLQRILLDASARRFQAQKIYMRATAAVRWINSRYTLLRGQKPQNGQIAQLQQLDRNLRTELAAITNERIFNEFRAKDAQAQHYLAEDPSLTAIINWIRAQ